MDFIDFIVNFSEASESSHFPRFFYMMCKWYCHEMGDFYALFIISNVMNCGENQETGKEPTKSERIKKTLPSVDLKMSLSITRLFALPLWRIKLLLVVAIMNANDTSVDPISNEWGKVVSSFRIYYHFQAMLRITLKTFSSSFFAHPFYDR